MAFNNIPYIAVDLFCGAGGLSLGLENSGINVELGIEINPIAATTYRNNLNTKVIVDDIRNISIETVLKQLEIRSGELFLLAGCPPCQTFSSLQRENDKNDERNNLIFEYVRLVQGLKPLFIQLENVPGLKRGRGKSIFTDATNILSSEYIVVSDILNCADFGIPQSRRRLLLHGVRKDVYTLLAQNNEFFSVSLPHATHTKNPKDGDNLLPWVPSSIAFIDLPAIAAGDAPPEGFPNHETNALAQINKKRIQYIQANGGSRNCLPKDLQLPCHQKSRVGYTGVYGIIDPAIPAPTITGGCITYSKGRYGHPDQPRAISVREAARLQSFPDTYVFSGSRSQTALQVGNAVPPLLAQASGQYFISLMDQLHQLPA